MPVKMSVSQLMETLDPERKHFPKIITLCGSTRFQEEYERVMALETLKGNIVISVGLFGHKAGLDMRGDTKKELDKLHKRKIDLSDEILVINPKVIVCSQCGKPSKLFTELSQETECCRSKRWQRKSYIGESTRNEIEYAKSIGVEVRYLEQ